MTVGNTELFPKLRSSSNTSTSIIQGRKPLLPVDDAKRLDARIWDRFFDLYVQVPMQKVVTNRLRPAEEHDQPGVADAKATLKDRLQHDRTTNG